ncbi:MAG: 5'-methylthioadenosine/adenosylhomocysteine nucleosidase [Tessaracoccus sp.]|uniref:5'-methylthioadenosine/adenosylhomocysteine nucleosidase n=1 Tax=Tessaracoccus sp. TaxID=1971211 RepID=UPI001ED3C662|nr:5'-methylthioadenosine/adenosylhomocysteine nucleosidase [Tessaracoccus sp.]MBK7820768.1 5'-methylthioadenosine/adenosylhomocysteine nucleosidase [Tessaracoccus sp.]
MIAIVAALRAELSSVLEVAREYGEVTRHVVAGRSFLEGRLAGHDVMVALSGVGKVAAAATATLLAERADAVVMVGTAGGIGSGVRTGDVVVADALLQHDVDARPLFPRWQVEGTVRFLPDEALTRALSAAARQVVEGHRAALPVPFRELGIEAPSAHTGLVASGDQFIATREDSDRLRADLPDLLAVEMEGAALAQVCATAGVPFALARTISDRADDDAHLDFSRFLDLVAAPYAHDLVLGLLARLPAGGS